MRRSWLLVNILLLGAALDSWAAPTLGSATVNPSAIRVGVASDVVATADIDDPTVIPASVNLQRLSAGGTVTAVLGTLHDDGLDGDAVAGDKVFSIRITLNENREGTVSLRVSAAFKGVLRRGTSKQVRVTAMEADAVGIVDSRGGSVEVTDERSPLFGYKVSIPPGALTEAVALSIRAEPGVKVVSNPDKEEIISSPSFALLPHGLHFAQPVTIELPYLDSDQDGTLDGTDMPVEDATVFYADEATGEWIRAASTIDRNERKVVASTLHFSNWVLLFSRWKTNASVTYYIDSLPLSSEFADSGAFEQEVYAAFRAWSVAVDDSVTFRPTASRDLADVLIRTLDVCAAYPGDADLCEAEAGGMTSRPLQRLSTAHSITVTFNAGTAQGTWVPAPYLSRANRWTPFLRIALHEFGHAMGLPDYDNWVLMPWPPHFRHSYNPTAAPDGAAAIMFYDLGFQNYSAYRPYTTPGPFDVNQARYHYGLLGPGGRIVFSSDRLGSQSLWVLDLATKETTRVADLSGQAGIGYASGPRWSPDGRRISFTGYTNARSQYDIYVVNSDGSGLRRVTNATDGSYADRSAWDPVRPNRLYYLRVWPASSATVHYVDIATLQDTEVPNASGRTTQSFDVTSDGAQLLFSREPSCCWTPSMYSGYQDLLGSSERVLKPTDNLAEWLGRINRQDNWIAYHEQGTGDSYGSYDVFKMSPEFGQVMRLTRGSYSNYSPTWTSGGNEGYIVFYTNMFGNYEIAMMKASAAAYPHGVINLTNHAAADRDPDWTPRR